MWCPTRFNSWPFVLLIYIDDLPTIVYNENNMALFADDTSIIITDTNRKDLNKMTIKCSKI